MAHAAVGFLVIIEAMLIDGPLHPQASRRLAAIARLRVGPPFVILPEAMDILRPDLDLEVVYNAQPAQSRSSG